MALSDYLTKYHKIPTVFKRDPETKFKTLLDGVYATPELAYLKDCQWVFTEKVDGTNIRVMFDGKFLKFGGKTDRAQIPGFLLERLEARFMPLEGDFREIFPEGVCFYGEGYGAKIQRGGGNYRPDQDFVLFDVRIEGWWLQRQAVEEIANNFGLDVVPIVGYGTLQNMVEITRQGFRSSWGDFDAEGLVARPHVELKARNGSRIITKVKQRDFR